jgi:photosystem II stability/assembly factor-like uncharacterized protein
VCDAPSQSKRNFSPPSTLQANNTPVTENDTVILVVQAGWNLISLPVEVSDPRKSVLFPTAISDAYTYENSYVVRDTLASGVGYWLKFPEADTVTLVGSLFEVDSIEVNARWNLIGAPGFSLLTTNITTVPESLIVTDYFAFDPQNGYSAATTLEPGKGYWVKTHSVGKLFYTPWEYLGLPNLHITGIAVADSMTIYAATQWGLYKTTNAGDSWDTLLPELKFVDLKMHPSNPQVLYAALGGTIEPPYGILKTTDGGTNWFFADSGIFVNWETYLQTIEFDPLSPETLYAGTSGFGAGEIYKTTNGGINWFSIATNDTLLDGVWTIAIHPGTTSIIFAGSLRLLKSTNAGATWYVTGLTLGGGGLGDIAIDYQNPQLIYATMSWLGGNEGILKKSTDGGLLWQTSNQGLPPSAGGDIVVSKLTSKVFVNVGGKIFESVNCGLSWAQMHGLPGEDRASLIQLTPDHILLYVGIRDYGTYRKKLIH